MPIKTKNAIPKNKYGAPITDWSEVPEIFDIAFAVRLLRQDYYVIRKKCANGQIPVFKFGHEWRFRKSDIEKWIDGQIAQNYKLTDFAAIAGQSAENHR